MEPMDKIIAEHKVCRLCRERFWQSVSEMVDGAESFQSINRSDICRKCLENEGMPFSLRDSEVMEFIESYASLPENAPLEDFRELDKMAAKLGLAKANPSRPRRVKPKSARRTIYQ